MYLRQTALLRSSCIVLCLGWMSSCSSTARAEVIWIEGEAADTNSMRHHDWYDRVAKDNLSAGDWLSHFATGDVARIRVSFRSQSRWPISLLGPL